MFNVKNELGNDRLILVNKPLKWTSFDVVRKIRKYLNIRKVGHGGTLDPLATGLMIIGTGSETKALNGLIKAKKEYIGTFFLGLLLRLMI